MEEWRSVAARNEAQPALGIMDGSPGGAAEVNASGAAGPAFRSAGVAFGMAVTEGRGSSASASGATEAAPDVDTAEMLQFSTRTS